jgi:predicted ATPase
VRGERQFPVSPLAVPPRAPAASVAAVRQYAAVCLFMERAVAIRPDFVITNVTAPAVAEICIRLDGLPLAIELAAARTKLLGPEALLARLSQRLPVLTTGARDLAARHQTLRGAIAWSYDLLAPAEQTLFRRLAAFAGGWTLDAAAQVAGGRAAPADGDAADSGLPAALAPGSRTALEINVLDGLAALVEQSLLWSREGRDGEPRFGMLETIREFAAERLRESGEAQALARIHMMFFTALAEQAEAELAAPRPVDWLDRLEEEHDNFRAALDWAEVSGAVETGLRIAMGLFEFWSARGYWSEGRARLARLLAGHRRLDNDFIRAKALMRASYLAYAQTDLAAAWALAQPAEAVFRRLDTRPELAECLRQLGQTAFARGDFGAGYTLVQESVDLFREIRRLPGGEGRLATALRTLGWGARERGEYKEARAALEESLSLARGLGHDMALMGGLRHLAVLERVVGDYGAASRLLEQSVKTAHRLDHVEGAAYGLLELARVRRWQGALPDAVALAAESLGLFRQLGDTWAAAACVAVLGGVAASAGHAARAVRLLGAAVTFTDAMGAPFFPEDRREHDGYLVTARASLDEARFATAWAEGRRLTLEEAITEALAEAPPDA